MSTNGHRKFDTCVRDNPRVYSQGDRGLARLRDVIEAKDTEIGVLRSGLDAERGRRLELRVAELERRLDQDSTDSGTPTST